VRRYLKGVKGKSPPPKRDPKWRETREEAHTFLTIQKFISEEHSFTNIHCFNCANTVNHNNSNSNDKDMHTRRTGAKAAMLRLGSTTYPSCSSAYHLRVNYSPFQRLFLYIMNSKKEKHLKKQT